MLRRVNYNIIMTNTIWAKVKESFITAATAAVIVLFVILLVWIPLKLIPRLFSNGSSYIATSLTSTFIPNATTSTPTEKSGTTNVYNTYNSYGYATTSANKNVASTVNVNGRPDLAVRLLAVGTIDRYTKQLSQTQYANATDEIGIKFEIVNIGDSASGVWSFKATLPSMTTPNYQSDNQVSLNPGDRIQYVLGFDNPTNSGTNNAYITIDSLGYATDSNVGNNSLTVPISVIGATNYNYTNTNTNYPYNYNYNYGNTWGNNYNYNGGTTYTWTSLSGNCSANPTTAYTGQAITWNANPAGGNGYYTYSWNGSDNMFDSNRNPVKTYYTTGTKTATVTITSNGSSITKQCGSVNIIDNVNVIGGNTDVHGCLGSAGYSWCDVKNKCLRTWEESCSYNTVSGADLSASLIGVGTIDSYGQFVSASQVSRGGNAAVKVRITNIGASYSGTWSITGTMSPSLSGYTYRQDNQSPLTSGASADYTIVFGNPQITGTNSFSVQITPNASDTNSGNNSVSATIQVY